MAKEWVKDAYSETRVAFDARSEVEVRSEERRVGKEC